MSDNGNFKVFKQTLIDNNEQQYGEEIRAKYGDKAVNESNEKLKGLTREQYNTGERLRLTFEETLRAAFETGNPAGELAQKACELHKKWLCVYYPKYSREYHIGLSDMYVTDERFKSNYDKIGIGCAEFLRSVIHIYCKA